MLDDARWRRVEEVFHAALECEAGDARARLLEQECGGDAELRAEVERLLRYESATFLEQPAASLKPVERPVLAPGATVGHYRIVELLGEGGMGRVYRARDSVLKRDVALKVLASESWDPARLRREARMLAALRHPNVAGVYGFEHDAIVMEMVEGETLAERMSRGPVDKRTALDIARQIARGLAAAHAAGIIHRDLKPANVKIGTDGAVKVLDFGLAKSLEAMSSSSTSAFHSMAGVVVGTAAYMAPEQASGGVADKRWDVYAFGVLMRELMGARAPAVVSRCLAADPGARPADMGEVGRELEAAAGLPGWLAMLLGALAAVAAGIALSMQVEAGRRGEELGRAGWWWTWGAMLLVGVSAGLWWMKRDRPAGDRPRI